MLGNSKVEAAAMDVGGSIIFLLNESSFQARSPEEHGGVDHFCLTFTDPEFREILDRTKAMGVRLEGGVMPRTGATGRSDSQYILDPGRQTRSRSRTGFELDSFTRAVGPVPATVVRRSNRRSSWG